MKKISVSVIDAQSMTTTELQGYPVCFARTPDLLFVVAENPPPLRWGVYEHGSGFLVYGNTWPTRRKAVEMLEKRILAESVATLYRKVQEALCSKGRMFLELGP
mgnify:CR=1 FL=1